MSAAETQFLLNHDCGLMGLSGISNDMRELLASDRPVAANERGVPLISGGGSRVALYVLPTDEESMIARHALAVLMRRGRPV